MSSDKPFKFSFRPESLHKTIQAGHAAEFGVTVINTSGQPLRAKPKPIAVAGPPRDDREPLAPEAWAGWLSVTPAEGRLFSEHNAHASYSVKVELPQNLRLGTYQFRLGMLGVEDPDREIDLSETLAFTAQSRAARPSLRRFAIVAFILLAVGLLVLVGAMLLARPRPNLRVEVRPPASVAVGQTATYTVTVANVEALRATNLVMTYTLPPGVVGAVARLEGETYRHCDAVDSQGRILCGLGTLEENESIEVLVETLPEAITGTAVLTNTDLVTLAAQIQGANAATLAWEPFVATLRGARTTQVQTSAGQAPAIFVQALPSLGTAAIGETFNYQIRAWHTADITGTLWLTYTLPEGLQYGKEWPVTAADLQEGQCRPTSADYFTLMCNLGVRGRSAVAERIIQLQAVRPLAALSSQPESRFTVALKSSAAAGETAALPAALEKVVRTEAGAALVTTITDRVSVVDSVLFFDGVGDWVELDYSTIPRSFTVEMWVHPFSFENNQALIGAHLPAGALQVNGAPNRDGENLFLVGFYNDGLDVRVGPGPNDHFTLDIKPRPQPFHLAIAVERRTSPQESRVYVYIDGALVDADPADGDAWRDVGDAEAACNNKCKIYDYVIPSGLQTLNWVLGQDWDTGFPNRRRSDFFKGTLGEVRIWEGVRNAGDIAALLNRQVIWPLPGSAGATRLVGYWHLAPPSSMAATGPTLAANQANRPTPAALPATAPSRSAETLVDPQNPNYTAVLHGAGWARSGVRFGNALAFDGFDDGLVSTLPLTDFSMPTAAAGQTQTINFTLSAWVYVDNVPTQDAWIVGYAPLSALPFQPGRPGTAVAGLEDELEQLQQELRDAEDSLDQANQQVDRAADPLEAARSALAAAQAELIAALMQALGLDPEQIENGQGQIVNLVGEDNPDAQVQAFPAFQPLAPPGITFTPDVLQPAIVFDAIFGQAVDQLENAQKAAVDAGTAEAETLEARRTQISAARTRRETAVQAQADYLQYREKNTAEPDYITQLSLRNIQVHLANLDYLQALAPLADLNVGQVRTLQQILQHPLVAAMAAAVENLDNLDNEQIQRLRDWVNANTVENRDDLLEKLDALQEQNNQFNAARGNLVAARAQQQAAQQALVESGERQAILNQLRSRDEARRRARANLLQERNAAQAALDSAENTPAAQAQLAQVTAQLAQDRQDALAELSLQLSSLQTQEEILNELTPVLQQAIAAAFDAGRKAVEQQALENVADAILAQFLGIQPCSIPPKSTQEVVAKAAELAVQLSILNDADGRVKAAEARLAAVSEQQQCRQTQIEGARESLRQTLIQLLDAYLQSANAEVEAAQRDLEEAKAAQSQEDGQEAELPADLVDLLAKAIANEVSANLNNYLCAEGYDFPQLVCAGGRRAQDYVSRDAPKPIPVIGMTVSNLVIAGGPTRIDDLNVRLQGTHSYLGDLSFTLVSPAGTQVQIMARSCGAADNFNLLLDDNGRSAQGAGPAWPCPPVDGQAYRPSNPLSAFNGEDSNGTWKLIVRDEGLRDAGLLQNWSLQIQGLTRFKKSADGRVDFRTTFNALQRFQSGETTAALNARRDSLGVRLNSILDKVRYQARWRMRVHIDFINQQLATELREGIEGDAERRAKSALQEVLNNLSGTLRNLLRESNVLFQSTGQLEPDLGTAVAELERRDRFGALLADLKRLTNLAQTQLNVINLIGLSAEGNQPQVETAVRAVQFTLSGSAYGMQPTLSVEAPTLPGLARLSLKPRVLARPALAPPMQEATPTPLPPEEETNQPPAGQEAPPEAEQDANATEDKAETGETAGEGAPTPADATAAAEIPAWVALMIDNDGHVALVAKTDGAKTWAVVKENSAVPTGQWVHYAGVVSYTVTDGVASTPTLTLYRDGDEAKRADPDVFPTNVAFDQACIFEFPAGFYLGALCNTAHFTGQLDEVRLWRRALGEAEIDQWRARPGERSDELVYWSFEEGPGNRRCGDETRPVNVACDNSRSNRYHLVVSGPAWADADVARLRLRAEQAGN